MYNYIKNNINNLTNNIPSNIIIVAVSKNYSYHYIKQAYDLGQKHFGENYIQEMIIKYKNLPKDIKWHMIGNLQKNKIKHIAPFVYMIHSIHNLEILCKIEKEASKYERIIYCLLQIKISNDINKLGMDIYNAENIIKSNIYAKMQYVKIVGLMGMATFTDNKNIINREFNFLNIWFQKLKKINNEIKYLSMGMSYDYKIAIKYNANIIRIGNYIFGDHLNK